MLRQKLARFLSSDIGIDLGTANCLVYLKDRGIVFSEPSVVAISKQTHEALAVGNEAKKMLGRTPDNITALRPMKYGVIADYETTGVMLRHFIEKAKMILPPRSRLIRPRVLIAVPSGITEVETRAVKDSAERAGAGDIFLIEEPMASAIGVGLPVSEPTGSMIVDIGGGTTEVAVISLAGIVEKKSVRVGGDEMDAAISEHLKRVYNLIIGPRTAEEIKIKIGSVHSTDDEDQEIFLEVKGIDLVSRMPKAINISSHEIRAALQVPVTSIVEAVRATLEKCPPELASDLIDRGIMLAGGGSLMRGLDRLISEETGLPVFVADDPLKAVANGTGIVLQEMDNMARAMTLAK
ncbi:MAG: rod shape-determining protein [Victivallales bacterium]|nr:rod shape-determining protein [bacterium]MDD7750584.1 rod shape-determining protein [bacterium]MDY5695105.1 rod shape-determining protein [Victivallales bacterium]